MTGRLKFTFIVLGLFLFANHSFGQQKNYQIAAVGFYNLENLFDTLDTPDVNDLEFTPKGKRVWNTEKYYKKLDNLALVISKLATEQIQDGISILGVSEIENISVLEDLVKHPDLVSRDYQIIHFDSPDRRGIDVGLLYNPKQFKPSHSKAIPLKIYDDKDEAVLTRDVLYVSGIMNGDELHVLVNHWPSRSGGEKRSAPFRKAGADLCKMVYDSLVQINPDVNLIVMGDLNDDPVSTSVKKNLQAKPKKNKIKKGQMFNPMYAPYKKGIGSNAYRDAWSLFDQVILSKGLIEKNQKGLFYYKAIVYKENFMIQKEGKYKGYPMRTFSGDTFINGYSDHFPVYVYLLKER